MKMEDRCVSCGAVIPEGRQVCPECLNPVRKEWQEGGIGGQTMSRFDSMLKGLPKVRYIELKKPEVNFDSAFTSGTINVNLMAKVIDYENKVLFDAIVKYAAEQGFTNLYLIDEEFIKSAIINEIIRRKNEQREAEYTN